MCWCAPCRLAATRGWLADLAVQMENPRVFHALAPAQRLQLMKFVCSFAWADLSLHQEERAFVERLVERLGFSPDEERQIRQWLVSPPAPESIDPAEVPIEHRHVFLAAIDGVIAADGVIATEEREGVRLLKELLGGGDPEPNA